MNALQRRELWTAAVSLRGERGTYEAQERSGHSAKHETERGGVRGGLRLALEHARVVQLVCSHCCTVQLSFDSTV